MKYEPIKLTPKERFLILDAVAAYVTRLTSPDPTSGPVNLLLDRIEEILQNEPDVIEQEVAGS